MKKNHELHREHHNNGRRVLQVLGGLGAGGIETWLVNVLKIINTEQVTWDFVVNTPSGGVYGKELTAMGSRIFVCGAHQLPPVFSRRLARILTANGPYDVVHVHLHFYSGLALRVAHRFGVPVRIAHSHLADSGGGRSYGGRMYESIGRHLIRRHATHRIAASSEAGRALFRGMDYSVLRCGIPLTPRIEPEMGLALRGELGIPKDAMVIGHVGRFDRQKNHEFLVRVAASAMHTDPRVWLLLIGSGELVSKVEEQLKELGIRSRSVLAGVRRDARILMRDVINVLVFPSLYEGLPIALLEAQAEALPIVASRSISPETIVIRELVHMLELQDSPEIWASKALSLMNAPRLISIKLAREIVRNGPFSLESSAASLSRLYGFVS